jgi:hypothetical protein
VGNHSRCVKLEKYWYHIRRALLFLIPCIHASVNEEHCCHCLVSIPLPCPDQTRVGVCFGPQQAAILLDTEGERLRLTPLCYAFGTIHVFLLEPMFCYFRAKL